MTPAGAMSLAARFMRPRAWLRDPLHRNSIILLANVASAAILGLVFWAVVARFYSTSEVGLAAALVSASGLLSQISILGFDLGLIRFLPATKDRKGMINSCLTISGIASLVLVLVYIGGVRLWTPGLDRLQSLLPALLFIAATIGSTWSLLQGQVFIGSRRPEYAWVQALTSSVVRIPLALGLTSFGTWGIWGAWSVSTCAGAIVGNLILIRTEPGYSAVPQISRKGMREMATFSLGSYLANVASSVPMYVMPLVILGVLGAEANAYYYLGFKVAAVLYGIPWLVGMSLLVEGSHDPQRMRSLSLRWLRFVLPLVILSVAVLFVFGSKILLIFGAEYSESARWVLWMVSLSVLLWVFNEVYIVIKQVQLKVFTALCFIVYISAVIMVAAYVLMPRLGLLGAGLAWVIGNTAGVLWVGLWLWGDFRIKAKHVQKGGSTR